MLAHVRLKHQDKLVKSATVNVTSFSRTGLVTLRGTADTALWSLQDKELHRLRRCECSGAHWGQFCLILLQSIEYNGGCIRYDKVAFRLTSSPRYIPPWKEMKI